MREPVQRWASDRFLETRLPLTGWVAVIVVVILVGVPGFYFAICS